jgi:hypothetical protein
MMLIGNVSFEATYSDARAPAQPGFAGWAQALEMIAEASSLVDTLFATPIT